MAPATVSRLSPPPPPVRSDLRISVVVCTRDRPASLNACVRSVARQTVAPLELIVVDDGELSPPQQAELAGMCHAAGFAFVYLRKDRPGLTRSRNLAVRHARGDVVQFLDDDVTIEPSFLAEIMSLYAGDAEGVLLGSEGTLVDRCPPDFGARVFGWVYQIAGWWALRPRGRRRPSCPPGLSGPHRASESWNLVGATMAFRREVLVRDPFDESLEDYALGEDRDMAYRLGPRGWILRCHAARATHHLDAAGRPDPFRLGQMTVRNYLHILTRNGLSGVGERLVTGYSLVIIACALACFSLARPKRYFPEFLGVVVGIFLELKALLRR